MTTDELLEKGLFYPKDHYPFPAFEGNKVAIALCCDLKYLPYVMVTVHNLIDVACPSKSYDVFIQMEDPPPALARLCCREVEQLNNISLRFIDHSHFARDMDFNLSHWGAPTFYKLFAEPTFKHYKKVLYLDSDILILKDIDAFANLDLEGVYLAAVQDAIPNFLINGDPDKKPFDFPVQTRDFKGQLGDYFRDYLGFSPQETLDYLNFGMVVFNLEKFRQDSLFEALFNFLKSSKPYAIGEQDYLNVFFKDKATKKLGSDWVTLYYYETDLVHTCMSQAQKEEIINGMKDPFIIHFLAAPKPWLFKDTKEPYSVLYWTYVSQSCLSSLVNFTYLEHVSSSKLQIAPPEDFKSQLLKRLPQPVVRFLVLGKRQLRKVKNYFKR